MGVQFCPRIGRREWGGSRRSHEMKERERGVFYPFFYPSLHTHTRTHTYTRARARADFNIKQCAVWLLCDL